MGIMYVEPLDLNVKSIDHLYKIGYSETTVENRIKNAPNEPTYLMAPVKIVASYATYNINTHTFEDLLHQFFSEACISMSNSGGAYVAMKTVKANGKRSLILQRMLKNAFGCRST